MQTEIVTETWLALRTIPTRFGDSCFSSNLAIPKLQRHGAELLPTIESIINSPDFDPIRESEQLVKINLLNLLLVYFELADDIDWDSIPFLRSLQGPVLHDALCAVFQLWGPFRRANRRCLMSKSLYDVWHELITQDPEWIGDPEGLSRNVASESFPFLGSWCWMIDSNIFDCLQISFTESFPKSSRRNPLVKLQSISIIEFTLEFFLCESLQIKEEKNNLSFFLRLPTCIDSVDHSDSLSYLVSLA
jgi:hypothetical protein